MPEKETLRRARRDRRQGKSPSTQAGEFMREEIHHVREGKHGARSTKPAIAHARHDTASHDALSRFAKTSAKQRGRADRRRAARKAAHTRRRRA